MVIQFKNSFGFNYFRLNSDSYTLYAEEEEILLNDGLLFEVIGVDQKAEVMYNGELYQITQIVFKAGGGFV